MMLRQLIAGILTVTFIGTMGLAQPRSLWADQTLDSYLSNQLSADQIAANLVAEPNLFESRISALREVVAPKSSTLSETQKTQIRVLEKKITDQAIIYNRLRDSRESRDTIRVAGVVIGAVVAIVGTAAVLSGGLRVYESGVKGLFQVRKGSGAAELAEREMAGDIATATPAEARQVVVMGISIGLGSVAGGLAGYVYSFDDFENAELNRSVNRDIEILK